MSVLCQRPLIKNLLISEIIILMKVIWEKLWVIFLIEKNQKILRDIFIIMVKQTFIKVISEWIHVWGKIILYSSNILEILFLKL